MDQVRQVKQLRDENIRLKQLVAELTLDKTMLQDVLRKSCNAFAAASAGEVIGAELWGERTMVCPACFVPVEIIETGYKGAWYGEEAGYAGAGGEPVAAS